MKIRLIGDMSGTRDGQEWPPRGSTVDLPDDEAQQLIRGKMAVPAINDDVETAIIDTADVEERALTTESAPAVGRRSRRQEA